MTKRPFRKMLQVQKETQRIIRALFILGIEPGYEQTVHFEIRSYCLERISYFRNIFPVNGENDGEGSLPLLSLASKVKNEEDLFPAEVLVEFLSEDLVA